jgi:hypothetical protein
VAAVLPLRPLWHLGSLHPYEQLLTVLLAFGPFVVLGIVIWVRRRDDAREDHRNRTPDVESSEPSEPLS